MKVWISKAGLAVAAFYVVFGAVLAYFITSNTGDFLFYTFAIAVGASSQVFICCLIVFFLEMSGSRKN